MQEKHGIKFQNLTQPLKKTPVIRESAEMAYAATGHWESCQRLRPPVRNGEGLAENTGKKTALKSEKDADFVPPVTDETGVTLYGLISGRLTLRTRKRISIRFESGKSQEK